MNPGPEPLTALAERLGYRFGDEALLRRSMLHRSWCAEHGGEESNERLEFLGDAVLGWVVADLVFERYPALTEGQLTDLRKAVVNANALAEIAVELGLGPALQLGKGEHSAGGRDKTSILADALEAVIGAVYLDGGPAAAMRVVTDWVSQRLVDAAAGLGRADAKTRLQEITASRFAVAPVYSLTETGPDHAKVFSAEVTVADQLLGRGEGRSKKTAEQAAAAAALAALEFPVGA
jgi:ribonuclease III